MQMKALVYSKKNLPDRLLHLEVENPVPGDNEVLVKICAASVNAADYRSLKMGIIPKGKIFGADIAGIVESTGRNIRQFKPGDEVIGDLSSSGFGGYAEYVVAPGNMLARKPANLSFEESAALPLASVTALQALRNKGNIQNGQKVLIVGAGGGVGTFAVQLAVYFGGKVTAVCSTQNVGQTMALGAEAVIDYSKQDFTAGTDRYDLILAVNGNYPLFAYKRLLNQDGIYVMVGGSLQQIFKSLVFGKLLSFGTGRMRSVSAKPNQEDLISIVKLAEEGKIRPVIDRRFNFEQAIDALSYAAGGHAHGKVVINVAG
jgi:NADPH:quinone reductase-like Zn-dependent oxidoreductase